MPKFPIVLGENKIEYGVLELQAENENLKDQIIEMQRAKIQELEAKLSKFIETGVENGYIPSTDPNVKHKLTLRTSSEIARFLEQKSIKKVKHVEEIESGSS